MLQSEVLVTTDVSEERITSIIRVTTISELETTLAVTSNLARCEKTSVLIIATRHNIPQGGILLSHRRKNVKSYTALTGWAL
jgi:hypothetical protein